MKTTTYKYQVKNHYFESGRTNHRKIEAAYKAASKREGEGWQVIAIDKQGNEFTTCNNGFDFYIEDQNGNLTQIA